MLKSVKILNLLQPLIIIATISIITIILISLNSKEVKSNSTNTIGKAADYNTIVISGMEYAIFENSRRDSYGGGGITVVNITKDKLEVEKLKRQQPQK